MYKNKETKTQSLLKTGDERRRNIKGAYSLCDENTVKGKKILIIDDIVTTGATLSECCRVLKKAGAEMVTAAAFASAE
ncbi:MAG: ComF family protein [Oscillospiraceae bacterium]|nr:ComF family protein [Oscillospiraceae bacterium]